MSPFVFRGAHEDCQSVEIVPTFVHPLGTADIRALEADDSSALEMELAADEAIVDGEKKVGLVKLKANITFNKPVLVYALVQGGWLPLPFAIPSRFLVHRNVVILLRKIHEGKVSANAESLRWWTKFFSNDSAIFNPLPFTFEAGFRRKPTMVEFVSAYDEGATELLRALPNCHIVKFADTNYRLAYAQLEAFDARYEREVRFLQATCPLVTYRNSRSTEREVATTIVRTADQFQLYRSSLIVLAVLSCLYEDVHGTPPSIGRKVLKPKTVYTEADAFNAISDLRHMEIAAAGQTYFQHEAFALCTCDRPLALLWSALSIRGQSTSGGTIEFTLDLKTDLFSRLTGQSDSEKNKVTQVKGSRIVAFQVNETGWG